MSLGNMIFDNLAHKNRFLRSNILKRCVYIRIVN